MTQRLRHGRLRSFAAGFGAADLRRVQTGWILSSVGNRGFMVLLSRVATSWRPLIPDEALDRTAQPRCTEAAGAVIRERRRGSAQVTQRP